jgi:hypothetical protein
LFRRGTLVVERGDQLRDRHQRHVVLHDDDAVAQLDVDLPNTVDLGERGIGGSSTMRTLLVSYFSSPGT